ncbi:sugar O-acetyltransferase [Vibrio rumoiensis]|uniref:Acetyltransferase n=1 Tax=Vibrio rumoiensis 1S-45 TaxID=1188252 RepID=A0A1E5E3E9_9VIBR|nr:sugar O-acetyltransferase [Vibrio rumoiensis]OEF26819.1 acetyltransferase [Vibrio rumoiensis 1S-45]
MANTINDFAVKTLINSELIEKQLQCRDLLYEFNHSRPRETELRKDILSKLLNNYQGTHIEPPFICDMGKNFTIGKGGFINYGLTVLDIAPVTIGDHVLIAPNVQLCAASHPILLRERIEPFACGNPITIGDCVWIGAGTIVLGGVTIGSHSVIGAGSVVTKDIPDNVIAVGNPCKVLKTIDHGEMPTQADVDAMLAKYGLEGWD